MIIQCALLMLTTIIASYAISEDLYSLEKQLRKSVVIQAVFIFLSLICIVILI
jgi:hypothetical protein